MRKKSFGEFVDKKKRDAISQLRLVKKMLESHGFKVEDFLNSNEDDHYIFCHGDRHDGGFDGIRIYKIGNDIAFRVQKESKTHPYGSAYLLPIETMFHDFLTDENVDQKKAGEMVIEAVGKEVRKFFEKSAKAAKEYRSDMLASDPVMVRSSGTDYSALIFNKG